MPFNSLEAEGEQPRRKKERKYQDEAMQKYKKNAPSVSLSHPAAVSVSVGQSKKKERICHRTRFITKVVSFVTYFISFLHCCIVEKKNKDQAQNSHFHNFLHSFLLHPFPSICKTREHL